MLETSEQDLRNPLEVRSKLIELGEFLRPRYQKWLVDREPLTAALQELKAHYPPIIQSVQSLDRVAVWRRVGEVLVQFDLGDFPAQVLPTRRVPTSRSIRQQDLANYGVWNSFVLASAQQFEALAVEVRSLFPGVVTDTSLFHDCLTLACEELLKEWGNRYQTALVSDLGAEILRLGLTIPDVMNEKYGINVADELETIRCWIRFWVNQYERRMAQFAESSAPTSRGSGGQCAHSIDQGLEPVPEDFSEPNPVQVKQRAIEAVRQAGRDLDRSAKMTLAVWRVSVGVQDYSSEQAVEFFLEHWQSIAGWVRAVEELPEPFPTDLPTRSHFENETLRFQRYCQEVSLRWENELARIAKPIWDPESSTLKVGDWHKTYRNSAVNQIKLFRAFQDAGWPSQIPKPKSNAEISVTVRDLNAALDKGCPIRFKLTGAGQTVSWEYR